jgi:hypothetical protein
MNITDTIENQIDSILTGNNIYVELQDRWIYYLQSYLGGQEYSDAGHLTKYVNETAEQYLARCRTTPLENHCSAVVSVYNSFLFRRAPDRDLGLIEGMSEVEELLRDCDFENRSLNQFMNDLHTWMSVFGHAWVVVTQASVEAYTLADQRDQGVRPYLSMLTPLAVLDWEYERMPSGRYDLGYFKYVEDINGSVRVIKEWTKDAIKTTTVDAEDGVIVNELLENNELGYIPAVICYNKRSSLRGIGESDINDIADLQKFIYNATSEVEQSIRLNTHPSLVKTPDTQAGIGAGSIIHVDESMDPGLKPYLLEYTGASVDSIYTAIKHATDAIDKLANTGAVRATESRTMSGVAMETEFQLLNSKLSNKANSITLAEENIWRIICDYLGRQWTGSIEYPGSFNIRDTESEINQLRIAKDTATSSKVMEYIDRQILDWMDVDEEVDLFEPHVMQNPETGETRIAQTMNEHLELAAQGWIHPEE